MITLILSLILKLIFWAVGTILTFVFSFFPNFDFSGLSNMFSLFNGLLGKGLNLLYFISGPAVFVFGDIIILLFTFKHVVLPIVNFMRKVIIR